MLVINTKSKAWEKLPKLKKLIEDEKVPKFVNGCIAELTDKNKEKIKELEDEGKEYEMRILFVVEQESKTIGDMTSYVYMSNEKTDPWLRSYENDDVVIFWAWVENETHPWCSEGGTIGIIENELGLRRAM